MARAKAKPGTLNYGSVGIGSSQHLAGEYFAQVTGTKLTHVPYRNIAQYGPDLIAGTVPLGFQWFPNVVGADPGRAAPRRSASPATSASRALPDAPTTTEAGLPEYKVSGWFALAAPAGTPRPILERLNKELTAALNDPAVRAGFAKAGAAPIALSLDSREEIPRRRDRALSRHHHQGRHRADRVSETAIALSRLREGWRQARAIRSPSQAGSCSAMPMSMTNAS